MVNIAMKAAFSSPLTCSWCDGDQTSNHALDRTNDGWFLEENNVHGGPHEQAHGSCNVSIEHSGTGIGRSGVRITTVEAVPAEPEDTGTNK